MVVQLFAGIFTGAVLASIVWGIYLKTAKNKNEQVRRVREELMHDLGELWVDIDTLISSFRAGMMDERTFKNSFSAKIDAINHLLKPNLHLFEVYYVKYMETLIKEYNRIVHLREIPSDISPSSDFSSEMETSYAPPPEQTDLFITPVESSSVAALGSEPVDIDRSEETADGVTPRDSFVNDKTQLVEATAVSDGIIDTVVMEQVEEDGGSAESEAIVSAATTAEASDEVDSMFEEAFSSIEVSGEDIASSEKIAGSGREGIPPPDGETVVATDTTQSDIGNVSPDQEVTDETVMGFDHPMMVREESKKDEPETSLFGKMASDKSIGDEDFSMETLMDVDLNTIASHVAGETVTSGSTEDDIEKTRHFELLPEEKTDALSGKTELEVVIASDASHSDSAEVKNSVSDEEDIPEETTYTRAEELEKRTAAEEMVSTEAAGDDDDFEVIIPDSTGTEDDASIIMGAGEKADVPADNDSITGDDVAEKIGALEIGSVKNKEKQVPAAKESQEEKAQDSAKKEKAEAKKPEEAKTLSLKESEESITGDDVADKIDSFFGLFKEE